MGWDGSRDFVGLQRLLEDIERLIGPPQRCRPGGRGLGRWPAARRAAGRAGQHGAIRAGERSAERNANRNANRSAGRSASRSASRSAGRSASRSAGRSASRRRGRSAAACADGRVAAGAAGVGGCGADRVGGRRGLLSPGLAAAPAAAAAGRCTARPGWAGDHPAPAGADRAVYRRRCRHTARSRHRHDQRCCRRCPRPCRVRRRAGSCAACRQAPASGAGRNPRPLRQPGRAPGAGRDAVGRRATVC